MGLDVDVDGADEEEKEESWFDGVWDGFIIAVMVSFLYRCHPARNGCWIDRHCRRQSSEKKIRNSKLRRSMDGRLPPSPNRTKTDGKSFLDLSRGT